MTCLVDFWKIKESNAQGRPLRADEDIHSAALDIIKAVAFGTPPNEASTAQQIINLRCNPPPANKGDKDAPFLFLNLPFDPVSKACITLVESLGVAMTSPFPEIHHFLHRQRPFMRRAIKLKNEWIRGNIDKSLGRLEDSDKENTASCALDMILRREKAMAAKAGIKPNYHSPAIQDEVSFNPYHLAHRSWRTLALSKILTRH